MSKLAHSDQASMDAIERERLLLGRTVRTSFVYPPIPYRGADWSATFDGYEPGDLVGIGVTEQAAINDLLEQDAC